MVLAELLELAPEGVEEVQAGAGTGGEEVVEYAIYGAPGELPSLPDLRAAAGEALVEVSTRELPDDWSERWRRFHRPVLIAAPTRAGGAHASVPDLRVRPPWEAAPAPSAQRVCEIVIDPGQAFGTGAHATTRLCLELLLELACAEGGQLAHADAADHARADGSRAAGARRLDAAVLDVGTGSGVLAIAAAKLGFAPVLALDHERESVAAARENAAVNGVAIDVRHLDLRTQQLPRAQLVLANLLRPLLLELATKLAARPAQLIAGGLLREEADAVSRAFGERLGLHERARREQGEWAAVWLRAG